MLAEATTVGRPVYIYPLPLRASFRALNFPREWIFARAHSRPANQRGTVRPQQGLELLCARLIDHGFVRGLVPEEFQVLDLVGSDHSAIVIDLSF